jgi:tRNA A-37 threonylcarbamoyl transferase component Bud32
LAEAGPLKPEELLRIFQVDQDERWQLGECVPAEKYLEMWPPLAHDEDMYLDLVYGEFVLRQEHGEAVSVEAFCQRFPQIADRLREQLEFHEEFEGVIENVLPPTEPSNEPIRQKSETVQGPAIPGLKIEKKLAEGGVGMVFLVQETALNRQLALKVLRPEFVPDREKEDYQRNKKQIEDDFREMVDRFEKEAQITGQLQHPGIPPIHQLGKLDDGRPFFTMKLIKGETLAEGQTLAELLKKRADRTTKLSWFVNIFAKIAQTLAHAHERKVIHRDLKPSNVMVDKFGEVLLMDWGLAKVLTEKGKAQKETSATVPSASIVETLPSDSGENRT